MKRILFPLLVSITSFLVFHAIFTTFMIVPDERIMGAVQRIFYFHVGSAIACYFSFAVVFCTAIFYLGTEDKRFDQVTVAAAEVGTVFCTITLLSGSIWAHSAWNTWFRWEPRLVTFLLLWLIFIAFNFYRRFLDSSRINEKLKRKQSSILAIFGALVVPLVWVSIYFLPANLQLHPQVVENSGLKNPLFTYGMNSSILALAFLQGLLIYLRTKILILEEQ